MVKLAFCLFALFCSGFWWGFFVCLVWIWLVFFLAGWFFLFVGLGGERCEKGKKITKQSSCATAEVPNYFVSSRYFILKNVTWRIFFP